MTMPKYAASYEQHFHDLFEILSNSATRGPIELPFPDERAASYFRLRFYSFQRTVMAEAERGLEKALKHNNTSAILRHEQRQEQVMRSKRFQLRLSGSTVICADRDESLPEVSATLGSILAQHRAQQSAASAIPVTELIRAHQLEQSDRVYEGYICAPSSTPQPPEAPSDTPPLDPLVDPYGPPIDSPSTPKAPSAIPCDLAAKRLSNGRETAYDCSTPEKARIAQEEWAKFAEAHEDLPPHTCTVDGNRVIISPN
jgi:hypothetical protein